MNAQSQSALKERIRKVPAERGDAAKGWREERTRAKVELIDSIKTLLRESRVVPEKSKEKDAANKWLQERLAALKRQLGNP